MLCEFWAWVINDHVASVLFPGTFAVGAENYHVRNSVCLRLPCWRWHTERPHGESGDSTYSEMPNESLVFMSFQLRCETCEWRSLQMISGLSIGVTPAIPVFSVESLDMEQRQAISTVHWLNFQPTESMNIIKQLFYTTEFWGGNQNIDLREFWFMWSNIMNICKIVENWSMK